MGKGNGAYADLQGLGDTAVVTPAERRSKCILNLLIALTIVVVGGFSTTGWYIYKLSGQYNNFQSNNNWTQTMDKITDVDGIVAQLHFNVSHNSALVNAATTDLVTAKSQLTALTNQVNQIAPSVTTNTNNITNISSILTDLTAQLTAAQAELTKLDPAVGANSLAVAAIQTGVTAMNNTLNAAVAAITDNKNNVSGIDKTVTSQGAEITENNKEIMKNSGQLTTLQQMAYTTYANVTDIRGIIVGLTNLTNDQKTAINSINTSLAHTNNNVQAAMSSITNVEKSKLSGISLNLGKGATNCADPTKPTCTITCQNPAQVIGAFCTCTGGTPGTITYDDKGDTSTCTCSSQIVVFQGTCVAVTTSTSLAGPKKIAGGSVTGPQRVPKTSIF